MYCTYDVQMRRVRATIFEKKIVKIKCVLIVSVTVVWNTFHDKNNSAGYDEKMRIGFHV